MINMFYVSDNKYFKQLIISLISLTKTTKEQLNIINLTEDVPEYIKSKKTSPQQDALCTKILQEANPKSTFKSVDVSDLFRKYLIDSVNKNNKFYNLYVCLRLLAHMVPQIPDKVLYVDTDVLFPKDVKLMWDVDVSDTEFAGRRDLYRITKYLQSGVMLFNMKRIRENGTFDKALKYIREKKIYAYIDMTALNKVCKNKKLLPKKYNSYRWTKRAILHHVCTMREGHIPFTKKWWHRIKTDEIEAARKHLPMYADVYARYDELVKEYPECF